MTTWADVRAEADTDWALWLALLLPGYCTAPFAPHHAEFWDWAWAVEPGRRPEAFVGVWFRGGAKSTSAEAACAMLGLRGRRRYGLYVCGIQDQADDHVSNVASMLESDRVEALYPEHADRLVGKYGNSKGWRRNRLRTAGGFTLDALGLDSAARGVKLEEQRPDLLIIDDVDHELDSAAAVAKKVKTITKALLPAGAEDLAVIAIQNLIHEHSVFSQIVDGRADFLARRHVSGPVPAVDGLEVEERPEGGYRITAGTATWAGFGLDRAQETLDDIGLTAFLSECQHDVEPPAGGMFDHLDFRRCAWDELPDLVRIVVWVDPAVTSTDQSDAMGIQADGLGPDGTVYRLFSWERRTTPLDALCRAIRVALELGAEHVGIETDQGGDTWESVYREAATVVLGEADYAGEGPVPPMVSAKAGSVGPKQERAGRMLARGYERGQVVHVRGTHATLERALRRFPRTKPFDLVDASFWSWQDLKPEMNVPVRRLRFEVAA